VALDKNTQAKNKSIKRKERKKGRNASLSPQLPPETL